MSGVVFPIYNDSLTTRYLKRNLDIDIIPFTECNLSCPFCEVKPIDAKYDRLWFDTSIETLDVLIRRTSAKTATVSIAGGEIFNDRIFQFDLWDRWLTELQTIFDQCQIERKITVVSNLMTDRIDQLIQLANRHQLIIGTSFDLVGRWTSAEQIEKWFANVDAILQSGRSINVAMIAHKQNANAIINQTGFAFKYFKRLYDRANERLTISIEQYTDVNNLQSYSITDDQLIQFFKYLIDNYPKIHGFEQYFSESTLDHMCSCDTIDIKPNVTRWSCCNKAVAYKEMISRFGCLLCRYSDRCSPCCPTEQLTHSTCIDRRMFEFADEKRQN